MSVTELTEAASLSVGHVTRLELGDRPNVSAMVLGRLARALGVTMNELWDGAATPHPDPLAGTFELALDRRKLREVIEAKPARWRVSTIVRALAFAAPSDDRGVPLGGWPDLLDELEAGRTPVFAKTVRLRVLKRKPARKR